MSSFTFLICSYDGEIDFPMRLFRRNTIHLVDVCIIVDVFSGVHPGRLVDEDSCDEVSTLTRFAFEQGTYQFLTICMTGRVRTLSVLHAHVCTHSMNKSRYLASGLVSNLEAGEDGFRSLKMIRICLCQ